MQLLISNKKSSKRWNEQCPQEWYHFYKRNKNHTVCVVAVDAFVQQLEIYSTWQTEELCGPWVSSSDVLHVSSNHRNTNSSKRLTKNRHTWGFYLFFSAKNLKVCQKLCAEPVAGALILTDRFSRVKLRIGVSWYMSLFYCSQCIQLVFNDVLTLGHAQEALPFPCGKKYQKERCYAVMLHYLWSHAFQTAARIKAG